MAIVKREKEEGTGDMELSIAIRQVLVPIGKYQARLNKLGFNGKRIPSKTVVAGSCCCERFEYWQDVIIKAKRGV